MKAKGTHDVRVIAQGGDGGTTDIGFGCLSGMFERNDDVLYICYDNEAYMNTGVQRSSATPPAARTATTPAVGDAPGNVFGQGKNLPQIAMAHGIPYVATATVADLRDLEAKVRRAMEFRGARYIHILVPCPLGWGHGVGRHDPHGAAGEGDRALPGVRGRARRGRRASRKIRQRLPVEEYLKPQKRFAHLFSPQPRPDAIARIQAIADRNIRKLRHSSRRSLMRKPFAITLDPGSSLANHTGSWRTSRPVYVDRLPPCNDACPAGENIQGWLAPRRERRLRGRVARAHGRQPAARGDGPRLLSPVRDRVQPRASSTRRSASTRSSASSATRRSGAAGSSQPPAASTRQARARRRRRALRAFGRLPPGARSATTSTIHEAGPIAGGMMRFGIPKYRLPRDVLDAEIAAHPRPGRRARS